MAQHLIVLGHGKKRDGSVDPGARGVNKTERAYLEDLAIILKQLISEYKLPVTLKDDINTYDYNDFRNNTSYYRQFDSVTDLHLNAFNGSASGAEIILQENKKADETDARLFDKLSKRFGWRRWILSNWYQQTREAQLQRIPSYRLIEYCFCDNPSDIGKYVSELRDVARDTLEAILGHALVKPESVKPQVLYRVQTGAYKVEKNALELAKKLQAQGYSTYQVWERSRALYKVQVGAFANKDNAVRLAKELSNKGYETYIVTTGETDSVYIEKEHRYTNEEMALRVIAGHYGNGQTRVDNLRNAGYDPVAIQKLVDEKLISTKPRKEYLHLHRNVTSWRVYPIGVARTPQNAVGILNPNLYGGLEYEVLEFRENRQVAIIQTKMFGKVQIWIGADTKSLHSIIKK